MKVSVCVDVHYIYEVDVAFDPDLEDETDLLNYVDVEDPVYRELCGVLGEAHLNYEGETTSIINDETGEVLYAL